jgi:hypothetical protein
MRLSLGAKDYPFSIFNYPSYGREALTQSLYLPKSGKWTIEKG